jgi:hypothetical protein
MVSGAIELLAGEEDDHGAGIDCEDPRFIRSIRDGVCPICDSPLDTSPEWLEQLAMPCSSPVCDFVLRPHGRLSRTGH